MYTESLPSNLQAPAIAAMLKAKVTQPGSITHQRSYHATQFAQLHFLTAIQMIRSEISCGAEWLARPDTSPSDCQYAITGQHLQGRPHV